MLASQVKIPIPDGYELFPGRSRDNARAAIKRAVDKGFSSSSVKTRQDGYLIPLIEGEEVEDIQGEEIVEDDQTDAEAESTTDQTDDQAEEPDETWTVPQLREYAEAKEIDLGDAKGKKDVLAAIVGEPHNEEGK